MCGGIDDGLSDGVFPIGSDSGAIEIAKRIAENKPGVLIVGNDDCSMEIAECLAAANHEVAIVSSPVKCGHVGAGYGGALIDALSMALIAKPYMMHSPFTSGLSKLTRRGKEMAKCLLSSCEEYTSHNSGYCSKECKNKNQKIIKSTAPVL